MSSRIRTVTILSSLLYLTVISALGQEPAEDMLQSALYKQEVEGNLEGAIELFIAIAEDHAENRAIAARALLQLGIAYEMLGLREAERAYGDLVREYPEQSEVVNRARERLAILSPQTSAEPNGLIARRVWGTAGDEIMPGAVSPDGREVAFVQWANFQNPYNSGDLGVADVRTGELRIVGKTSPYDSQEGEDTYVEGAAWSQDGKRLAYSEWATTWDHQVLYVVDGDGSGRREISDNLQNRALHPRVWSSDGRFVVALVVGWDDVLRIAAVSVEDGTVTVLKTLRTGFSNEQKGSMTLSLSPDDRYVAYAYAPSPGDEPDVHVLAVDGSEETVVALNPATDLNPLWSPDGSHLVFLSDRSGSADLWAVEMSDGHAVGEPRLIYAHVGPVVPLGFTADGALSYLTHVPANDLRLVSIDASGELVGMGEPLSERFVGYNSRLAWSLDGSRVAYLSERPGAGLEPQNYLVVKSMASGEEQDIELTMHLNGGERPAWSADGRDVLLNAWHVERTGSGATSRRAAYRIDVESGEAHREPYIHDYADYWRDHPTRFVSGRQSETLRSLGVRLVGQRQTSTIVANQEPLRPDESLLWLRNSEIGWLRRTPCDPGEPIPNGRCVGDGAWLVDYIVTRVYGWSLSPEGSRLAYLSADDDGWNVWVRSVTMEGEPTLLHSHPRTEPRRCGCVIRWTPDGGHLVYGFGHESIDPVDVFRIDVHGGEPEALNWQITRRQLGEMAFAPDGRRAVLPVGEQSGRTEVWTLAGFPWDAAVAAHE